MNAKIVIDKLQSVIEKGMISISIGEKDNASFSDFGRLTVDRNGLAVKACSSQASSLCSSPLDASEEVVDSISFCISLPKLTGMLSSLPKDSVVSIEFENVKTDDYIGNLVFSSGKSLWKMPCLHANLVPDINVEEGEECVTVDRDKILEIISLVTFAANMNDAKFTTNNMCISIKDGKMFFGATDDLRCSCFILDCPELTKSNRFLVPIQHFGKIIKSFDKSGITLFSGKGFVRLAQGTYSVRLSLPNEADINSFPAFESLMQKDYPYKLRVMASRLKSMVTACNEMNRDEFLLKIDSENINFYAIDRVGGMTYKSSLPYTGDKVEVCIGVCSMFFVDYLKKNKEETLQIELISNSGKPKLIKLQDGLGSHYIMKALVDIINIPQD